MLSFDLLLGFWLLAFGFWLPTALQEMNCAKPQLFVKLCVLE